MKVINLPHVETKDFYFAGNDTEILEVLDTLLTEYDLEIIKIIPTDVDVEGNFYEIGRIVTAEMLEKASDKAREIRTEIETCMSDLAGGDILEADRMYDDPDVMSDMFNDRCHDACYSLRTAEDKHLAKLVCKEMLDISHDALCTAVQKFLDESAFFK